ncbi:MAG: efflux RND transporter permease subunit [Myxococcales bacterium]
MWIVRLALRRPYTIAVLCSLIAIFGALCASRMKTDILPAIDIPVVIVVWSYPGLSAEDMERRVVFISDERGSCYCLVGARTFRAAAPGAAPWAWPPSATYSPASEPPSE